MGEESVKLYDASNGQEMWSQSFIRALVGSYKSMSYYGGDPSEDMIFLTYTDLIFGVITHSITYPYSILTNQEYLIT